MGKLNKLEQFNFMPDAEETRRAARWDTIGLGAFGYYGR